jgi:hypothetical protein
VERAVDDLVGRVELHLDLAGIGVDGEGLMLGECGWSEYDCESEDCEGLHCIFPWKVLTTESWFRRSSIFSWRMPVARQYPSG